jgi:hypothetical protein
MLIAGSESSTFVAAFDGRTKYVNDALSVSGGPGQGFAVQMYEITQGNILSEVFPPTQVQIFEFYFLLPAFFLVHSGFLPPLFHLLFLSVSSVCSGITRHRTRCHPLCRVPLACAPHRPIPSQRCCCLGKSDSARVCSGRHST